MADFDPDSLLVEEAVANILEQVTAPPKTESVALEKALDRVSGAPVFASVAVPSFTSSAMDGYAVRHGDTVTNYRLVGASLAGRPFGGTVQAGECVRITTGAKLPDGADTVIMQEQALLAGHDVSFSHAPARGEFARAPGSDSKPGALLLNAGKRLSPADIGLLASQGMAAVTVYKKLIIGVISTGDELVPAGQPLAAGKIYDSNRPMLCSLLRRWGFAFYDGGTVRDDPTALHRAFDRTAQFADVIITSGGVSVGEADFVRPLLQKLGSIAFWKIAMKPGRPLTVAKYRSGGGEKPFFGLPGNPVSVAITFDQIVLPALEKMAGITPLPKAITLRARTISRLKKQPGRVEFQRGVLIENSAGDWEVATTGRQDSHILSALSRADCYIVLPLASAGAEAGEIVSVQLLAHRTAPSHAGLAVERPGSPLA